MFPAALLCISRQPLDRRPGDHREVEAGRGQMLDRRVELVEQRGAGRARRSACAASRRRGRSRAARGRRFYGAGTSCCRRSACHGRGEKVARTSHFPACHRHDAVEHVNPPRHQPALRQRAPGGGHLFHGAAQPNLFLQQLVARGAIFSWDSLGKSTIFASLPPPSASYARKADFHQGRWSRAAIPTCRGAVNLEYEATFSTTFPSPLLSKRSPPFCQGQPAQAASDRAPVSQ